MSVMPGALMFRMVVIIFMEPIIDEAPIICTEKIKNVTVGGAYSVDKGA
jgi:hypothetical protein